MRRYNEEDDTWYFYTRKDGLSKTEVGWISIDDDRVWTTHGYRGGGGPSYYDKSTGKWFMIPTSQTQGDARRVIIGDKSVWLIVEVPGPDSVARYDKANNEWTVVKPKGGHMGDATDLVEDGDYVWMSTFNDGINRFHMASGTWSNFNDRSGLLQNHVNDRALKVDDQYLWAGTPGTFHI
jgi:hypothetical protein